MRLDEAGWADVDQLLAATAEEVVEAGGIRPDRVHMSGMFEQRVVEPTPSQVGRKSIE